MSNIHRPRGATAKKMWFSLQLFDSYQKTKKSFIFERIRTIKSTETGKPQYKKVVKIHIINANSMMTSTL
jgi:hypothetical protein